MTVTQTQVCNLALDLLHQVPLGASDLSNNTKAVAQWFNRNWEFARDAVLRAYPWNFAITRAELELTTQAITGISKADPAVVTYSGDDNFVAGQRVLIRDAGGMTEVNGQRFKVANVTAGSNTFELEDTDSSAYTTYTSGGTLAIVPLYGWLYRYALPSGCLRVLPLTLDGTFEAAPVRYEVEGGYLLTDLTEPVPIRYIAQKTDPTDWDVLAVQALAGYLAANAAHWLTGKVSAAEQARAYYDARLAEARQIDGMESTQERPYADDVIAARYTTGGLVVE